MTARAYHARTSKLYWANQYRHYEFDTYHSDINDLKTLKMGSFKKAAVSFDAKFTEPAEKLECYIVTRKNKKYIVTPA